MSPCTLWKNPQLLFLNAKSTLCISTPDLPFLNVLFLFTESTKTDSISWQFKVTAKPFWGSADAEDSRNNPFFLMQSSARRLKPMPVPTPPSFNSEFWAVLRARLRPNEHQAICWSKMQSYELLQPAYYFLIWPLKWKHGKSSMERCHKQIQKVLWAKLQFKKKERKEQGW